ncbi:MAG: GNAT family N-acetyltransferase, partial [Pseudomonadota bacterium]
NLCTRAGCGAATCQNHFMTKIIGLTAGTEEDLAALHALAFPKEQAWTASAFRDLLDQPATLARGVWDDNKLVAFILVQLVEREAEILTLATAPEGRRRGFARALIDGLEQELCPAGLENWLLDVAADNSGALAFYKSLGFQTGGIRRNYYKRLEGLRIDAILMSKAVGGHNAT